MKLGFGFYRHQLTRDCYRFARQCGCTHAVAHLTDYFRSARNDPGDQPVGDGSGWGLAGDPRKLWTTEEIRRIRREMAEEGLTLEAIENFDPAFWGDVLLDGPRKAEQLENCKTIIQRVGEAGVPVFGYNFSIAGVCGRVKGSFARGGAEAVGMDGPLDDPMPNGMVWNMVVDAAALKTGFVPAATEAQLWARLKTFLDAVLPVAEKAGVRLAAHPDDPPMPTMRGQPRLVYQPRLYQRLLDLHPSPSNALEFCLGSLAEMTEGDIYETVDAYSRQGKIGYIHFRNIRGKVPNYREAFIDDGDMDMRRIIGILRKNGFDGVMVPDHTPLMTCAAPWEAGMAFTCGWMKAVMESGEN
jgi:mannonate dehydratase